MRQSILEEIVIALAMAIMALTLMGSGSLSYFFPNQMEWINVILTLLIVVAVVYAMYKSKG